MGKIKFRLSVMNFMEFAVWGPILHVWATTLVRLVWALRFLGFMPSRELFLFSCQQLWELLQTNMFSHNCC